MNEVLRQEKKFLISLAQFYQYTHYFDQIIQQDIHNKGEGYTIRSLYFDTLDDKDFTEKEEGVEIRRKIRLRNYGAESSFAVLEMKQKQGSMQKKRSLKMPKEDAQKLVQKDYSVLLKYSEPFAAECYYLLNALCYSPKAVVEYKRKAYIAKENNIRITFDYQIRGTESYYDIFSKDLLQNTIFNSDLVVLEVKYNGFLLSYLKDILQECNASEISVSKYCLGRSVSKHYLF
ncbi:polyphosphate polymerase domain-containing protein [Niameybacter massiliensis]|uniref:polyphosphate polymerase domain-containing protein n=1 Tax=Niameybacter massiliensis TaxID=1658108 RepID=UPI0006B54ED3|nr:polyphosphate polymerase domain-containing protein [Niameybacter massiliensis]